jgi:hypothetical protein
MEDIVEEWAKNGRHNDNVGKTDGKLMEDSL